MLRGLLIIAASTFVTTAVRAQASTVTTNCERNARGTKETCTSVGADTTVTTVCVLHRGYWKWQSDKASCTTITTLTQSGAPAASVVSPASPRTPDAFSARYAALRKDFAYGDSLVKAATARGDTVAMRRLSADQVEMMTQLLAMSDTAAKRKQPR